MNIPWIISQYLDSFQTKLLGKKSGGMLIEINYMCFLSNSLIIEIVFPSLMLQYIMKCQWYKE